MEKCKFEIALHRFQIGITIYAPRPHRRFGHGSDPRRSRVQTAAEIGDATRRGGF
jgi:hypothetical protein